MGRRSLEIINRWSFEEDIFGLRTALGLTHSDKSRLSLFPPRRPTIDSRCC